MKQSKKRKGLAEQLNGIKKIRGSHQLMHSSQHNALGPNLKTEKETGESLREHYSKESFKFHHETYISMYVEIKFSSC